MRNRRFARVTVLCAIAAMTASISGGAVRNDATPGDLLIDNPTVHNLAFRWLFEGDANANATAAVRFREAGDKVWRTAQPLKRVAHSGHNLPEDLDLPPLLAGSILDLEPATEYEVELIFDDPDGGRAVTNVTVATRPEPEENREGNRTMWVYPEEYEGVVRQGFSSLRTAFAGARPGDVVILDGGVYKGPFTVTAGGTAENPIVFRGYGEPVIDGQGDDRAPVILLEKGVDHVHFERLNIRSGRVGIRGVANRGIVVRNCRIADVRYGVVAAAEPHWSNEDWYIADNTMVGRYWRWRVWDNKHFGAGVQVAGRGHVICHNRIDFFWDGIATGHCRARDIDPAWLIAPRGANHAIDIYNNDIRHSTDDAIEADYLFTNIRIMRNRMLNNHVGISVQPSFSGPHYIIRNVSSGQAWSPWKLSVGVAGALFYHNTTVSHFAAVEQNPPTLRNSRALNNVFLGHRMPAQWSGVAGAGMENQIDYNAYNMPAPRGETPQPLVRWTADGGKTWQDFMQLDDFTSATGHERHGMEVTFADFVGPVIHAWRERDYRCDEMDLRLNPESSAVNAGIRLPNVNDGHTGTAPDLGAYESGAPLPLYGPRPSAR